MCMPLGTLATWIARLQVCLLHNSQVHVYMTLHGEKSPKPTHTRQSRLAPSRNIGSCKETSIFLVSLMYIHVHVCVRGTSQEKLQSTCTLTHRELSGIRIKADMNCMFKIDR